MNDNKQNVSLFQFHKHPVHVVEIDGSPWFVAASICRCLEMNVAKGTHKWLSRLGSDEKQTHTLPVGIKQGNPNVTVISESGLYKLIMRSDKPEAKAFQDWVTREVLPSIRKNGGYIAGQEKVATGEMTQEELVAAGTR